jgi:poly(beta-D-mannuronate) C5 epimerase
LKQLLLLLFFLAPFKLFAGYCYSIATEVDNTTPVSPLYDEHFYIAPKCRLVTPPYLFKDNIGLIGCYKKKKTAKQVLEHSSFPFKNPRIIYHKVATTDPYIIFPNRSTLKLKHVKNKLKKIYKNNTIEKISKKFPKSFYGKGIEIMPLSKITFLPRANLYSIYKTLGSKAKAILLYDGVYNMEILYKYLHNNNYIKKIDDKTYELKIPIVISSTASLVIQNKIIRLQTKPTSVFVLYYGKLYLKNNKFYTWNTRKNIYEKREKISKNKLLYLNHEKPRPYFTGLAGSVSYIINNEFKGLGFHSSVATFGLSLLSYPYARHYYREGTTFKYFLSTNKPPKGIYIGNEISDATMGFYTNGAKDSYYLGNYLHDNIIYNFDPHDYSDGLVIARNVVTKAKNAHGIIISRSVDNSIIAQNITLKNHSSGIMIDKLSNNNVIYENFTVANGYMGISIQESKNLLVSNNTVALNTLNGIIVRNSLSVSINNNAILHNGKNGIEVMSKNIDTIRGRDFRRDPYSKASSAVIQNNNFQKNYTSNIMVKNSSAIYLRNNKNNGFKQLEGDLNFFYKDILNQKGNFTLYGRGFPFHAKSSDLKKLNPYAFEVAKKIYIDIADTPNSSIGTDLGIGYLKNKDDDLALLEFKRASSNLTQGALSYLGYRYLINARENGFKDNEMVLQGLIFIMENEILANSLSEDLDKLVYFIPNSTNLIEKAFRIALSRMQLGRLFQEEAYKHSIICKNSLKKKYAIQTAAHIFLYKMNLLKAKSLLEYCKIVHKDSTIFSKKSVKLLNKRLKVHNRLQDNIQYSLSKTIEISGKNMMCKKYKEHQGYVSEQSKSLLKTITKKEIENLLPQLQIYLDNVNIFRKKKLKMEELVDTLTHQEDN